MNKVKLALILSLLWACISWAIPPEPNEYILKANEQADVIVEGRVTKCDTLTISDTESYFVFTIDVIYEFKDRKNNVDKIVQVKIKRNLPWENGQIGYSHYTPYYLSIDQYGIFLLYKENHAIEKYYQSITRNFYFNRSQRATYAARGFDLGFDTVQDFYLFIKSLAGTSVPSSLTDKPQKRKFAFDFSPRIDTSSTKEEKELHKQRLDYQRLVAPIKEKEINEKLKRINKKSSTQKNNNQVVFTVKLDSVTFAYEVFKTRVEFNVMISASSTVYLDNFLMKLSYNTACFGNNIATNKGIQISKLGTFNTAYYDNPNISVKDISSDVIAIPLSLNGYIATPVTRSLISTTPTKMLRISMLIKDCSQSTNIAFSDIVTTKKLNFYVVNNPANYLDGEGVTDTYYNGTVNPAQMCVPVITNINPTTVTAGTNSKITITGYGFGKKRGNGSVVFEDANTLGNQITEIDSVDVISWSDTKIEYIVTSIVKNRLDEKYGISGTGKISIYENFNRESLPSTQTVTIPFAIMNYYSSNGYKYPSFYTENTGTPNAMSFYVTEEIYNLKKYYDLITSTINDFSCATGLNFVLAPGFVSNSFGTTVQNNQSIISLNSDSSLSSVAIMVTHIYNKSYCTNAVKKWYVSSEADIYIKRSANWNTTYPENKVESEMLDFYNALLHELGHAAQLNHVISKTNLIKPVIIKGPIESFNRFSYLNFPFDPSINGVKWMFDEGSKLDYTTSTCKTVKTLPRKSNCSIVTEAENRAILNKINIVNPIIGNEIAFKIGENFYNTFFNYELVNLQGEKISSGEIQSNYELTISINEMKTNLYVLTLIDKTDKKHIFKIIKE